MCQAPFYANDDTIDCELSDVREHITCHEDSGHGWNSSPQGVDPRTVAGRLGHGGGGSTTLRTYSAWVVEADQRAAAALGARRPRVAPRRPGARSVRRRDLGPHLDPGIPAGPTRESHNRDGALPDEHQRCSHAGRTCQSRDAILTHYLHQIRRSRGETG